MHARHRDMACCPGDFQLNSSLEPFELYAILYARHSGRLAAHNYLGGGDFHDADSNLDYFVWVAKRGSEVYLIDTGFGQEAADARGREILMPVSEGLRLLGLEPNGIENVILTHLHYDHAGTLDQFSNATFHLQDAEAAYATGRCMCHASLRHPFDVKDVMSYVQKLFGGQIKFHSGTSDIAPGLSVHLVGGHTAGLQVVRVWTQRGWVVLASDASHLYGNMEREIPFPAVHHVANMLEGYQIVRALAESDQHIIPGHDPQVMLKYPAPSVVLAGKVVCLDVNPKD